MKNRELTLRPFNDADINLMTVWLKKDYIINWYHDADEWLAEISQRNETYCWIHHFIVMDFKTPIGFCQYYVCYDAGDLENWYHVTISGDTFSIDYLIGNEAYLNKGYGKEIVRLLTNTIQTEENARQIIVKPEKENHASNHVLMWNGYIFDEKQKFYRKLLK